MRTFFVKSRQILQSKWGIFGEKFNEDLAKTNHSQDTKLIPYNV